MLLQKHLSLAIALAFIVISLTKTSLSLIRLKALTFFKTSLFLYIAIILMNYKERHLADNGKLF